MGMMEITREAGCPRRYQGAVWARDLSSLTSEEIESVLLTQFKRVDDRADTQEWVVSVFGESLVDPMVRETVVLQTSSSDAPALVTLIGMLARMRIDVSPNLISVSDGYVLASAGPQTRAHECVDAGSHDNRPV
ncbi:hypothetical protein IT072_03175 [Leifsonia sp. ZF2019]|uniref:hypothetical protein n=1 Tax=Leifsonia sp. ZF2019 TaxID=2781978 RepID=UPI001CBB3CFD|nr:hypothetical protein [Leifsonia sp. ZF2019]UAJ80058.1 hypothetical protein IT072_03010 [Leifsonia sp. ZF2019]UAJ80078.1 hypothetical protein IT072_03175 [Leifsonia sp. ZF2019]